MRRHSRLTLHLGGIGCANSAIQRYVSGLIPFVRGSGSSMKLCRNESASCSTRISGNLTPLAENVCQLCWLIVRGHELAFWRVCVRDFVGARWDRVNSCFSKSHNGLHCEQKRTESLSLHSPSHPAHAPPEKRFLIASPGSEDCNSGGSGPESAKKRL